MNKRIRGKRPSPAMLVAIAALVTALVGTAYAAPRISLNDLSNKAEVQTVGVGKLRYVLRTFTVTGTDPVLPATVTALCPGNREVIGGGIKVGNDRTSFVNDQHPIEGGYSGSVFVDPGITDVITVSAICANSRRVTGDLPNEL